MDPEHGSFAVATGELNALNPVMEALKAKLGEGLVALVLFGSRARGQGKGQSDWDLLLIAEWLPENPFDRQLALRALLPTEPGAISLVAKTPQEFEAGFPPLYLDVAVDGVVVYDPQGYMKRKLEEIRGIIRQAGLRRSRRKDAFIWKWREKPQGRWRIDWSGLHGFEGGGTV
jgi:predicted nucleotidyltransferase